MNSTQGQSFGLNNELLAKERVYDYFEDEWQKDSKLKAEDVRPTIEDLVRPFQTDPHKPGFMDEVMDELAKIELSLKHTKNHSSEMSFENSHYQRATVSIINAPKSGGPNGFEIDQKGNEKIPSELGPYKNITEIGSGSFGIVCSALDSRDGKKVALKFPRKKVLANNELLQMFLDEAKTGDETGSSWNRQDFFG